MTEKILAELIDRGYVKNYDGLSRSTALETAAKIRGDGINAQVLIRWYWPMDSEDRLYQVWHYQEGMALSKGWHGFIFLYNEAKK